MHRTKINIETGVKETMNLMKNALCKWVKVTHSEYTFLTSSHEHETSNGDVDGIPAATRELAEDVSIGRVGLMGQWVAYSLPTHTYTLIHTHTHNVEVHVELEELFAYTADISGGWIRHPITLDVYICTRQSTFCEMFQCAKLYSDTLLNIMN